VSHVHIKPFTIRSLSGFSNLVTQSLYTFIHGAHGTLRSYVTYVGVWLLVEADDKPYAGQPVGDEAEEYHEHAEDDSAVLGQPAVQ
jgi:hypothetical protein